MKNLLISTLVTLLCCAALTAHAAGGISLGIGSGLSNCYVTSIAQDKRGVIWVATEDGLNVFDGSRFIPIYKEDGQDDGSALSGNELNSLFDDPVEPVMWIGTQRAGLNAFDYSTGKVTVYRHDESDPSSLVTDDITKISPTSDGKLLLATYWHGVDLFDPATGSFRHFNTTCVDGMPDARVWTVADGGNSDIIYVGCKNTGMTVVSMKNRRATVYSPDPSNPDAIPGKSVYALLPLSGKDVLVGTDCGLALFDGTRRTFRPIADPMLGKATVFDIIRKDDGSLLVATEFEGLFEVDLGNGFDNAVVRRPDMRGAHIGTALEESTIKALARDSYGNIWAGVWGRGVDFLPAIPPLFDLYGYSPEGGVYHSMTNRTASCVVVDADGRLWVGTDGGGLNVFSDGRRVAEYKYPGGNRSANHLQAALRDDAGNLWFGVFNGGLVRYDAAKGTFANVPVDGRNDCDVRDLTLMGDTLVAVTTQGIFDISTSDMRTLGSMYVPLARTLAIDCHGGLWVGTFGSGMMVYDSHGVFLKLYNIKNGFPSNTVNDIFMDSHDRTWVGTGEGLVCFNSPTDTVYTVRRTSDGLANSFVSAVAEDLSGGIWVSTNKGISYVDDDTVASYSHVDNMPQGAFKPGCMAVEPGGSLVFGALNGLCRFNPREVLASADAPPALVTDLTVYGPEEDVLSFAVLGQLGEDSGYTLGYDYNTLSLTVNVGNHALADRVEYSFCLRGFDKDWFANGTNTITYRSLPPGDYRFEVRTRIRNQQWSDTATVVRITITPPLWLTWWAKTIYVIVSLSLVLFVLYVYRRRVRAEALYNLEKKQRVQDSELADERMRFYTNVTHELRTPLTLIVGPLEDTLRDNSLNERDRRRLTVIHRSANKLLGLVNQVLEFRKSETSNKRLSVRRQNIATTVYEAALKYKELLNDSRVAIDIEVTPECIEITHDKEAVIMILDNLISNALKYTYRGRILIRACEATDEATGRPVVEISVSDTGYGISPDVLPRIFDRYYQERGPHQASGTGIGLALVKNLTDLHHGSISVSSKLNEGTTFVLRLFVDEQYPEAIHLGGGDGDGSEVRDEDSVEREEQSSERNRPVVLVVEDNEDLREYIADTFTDLYDVKTAANGKAGLEMARAELPDIIITDIMMPVMDGLEMCRRLKNDLQTCHIPVVVLTAKDSEPDREEGYASGADSYLTKPFSSRLLISRVNNILRERERLASMRAPEMPRPVAQAVAQPEEPSHVPDINPLDKDFLDKLHASVEGNISSENVDVSFLADSLCMSRATLYRKVKALTGLSPNEYIRKVRMQIAARLITEGKLTISEISFKVGINSTPYFRQCFRDEFGVNPSDYAKKGGVTGEA